MNRDLGGLLGPANGTARNLQAAKKARDLEIGKLKRRLKIQQRAEEGGADRQKGNDSEGVSFFSVVLENSHT